MISVSNVVQKCCSLLRKRGDKQVKKIVNILSVIGSITTIDGTRGPTYGISKTALNMITCLIANHLRSENFIIFAIHPGWVHTSLGRDHDPITSQESASGILEKINKSQSNGSGKFFDFAGKPLGW